MLLRPLSWIYSQIAEGNYRKNYTHEYNKSQVIAIGGVTMGGSGKTVVVQKVCEILNGEKVAVLSRGFGRKSRQTFLVNPLMHSYEDVGDEPLLLSRSVPVYVGKDRAKSAELAGNFDFLVLDDGITQRSLLPNVKLLVVDAEQRFGNGEMFPLGPNRLNIAWLKFNIDAAIVIGGDSRLAVAIPELDGIPLYHGTLQQDLSQLNRSRIVAFCGIGYPNKFFRSLEKHVDIVDRISFPDHYPFSTADIEKLLLLGDRLQAQIVTTEKDLVRIPRPYRDNIATVPIKLIWSNHATNLSLLLNPNKIP
jgi:tetraacyldisaccharide 4'-kinase